MKHRFFIFRFTMLEDFGPCLDGPWALDDVVLVWDVDPCNLS